MPSGSNNCFFAKSNAPQQRFVRCIVLLLPLDARGHIQQALDRDRLFVVIDIRNLPVRKIIHDRMVDTVEDPIAQRDGGQGAGDAFGHRSEIMADPSDKGGIVGFSDDSAMADDHQAVLLAGADGFDQPRKAAGIHALLLRRRNRPRLRRPRCFRGVFSVRRACERGKGDKTLSPGQQRRQHRVPEIHWHSPLPHAAWPAFSSMQPVIFMLPSG
jgi:hypothetical protein